MAPSVVLEPLILLQDHAVRFRDYYVCCSGKGGTLTTILISEAN